VNRDRTAGTVMNFWKNRRTMLSYAIGLVVTIVLAVGFAVNALIPSIPLAAAFACAGALGPTDAAAVGALGSTISLTRRQKTLLTGEALINDASGVVSFQFAIAAAVTGAFSLADAGTSFLVLFFGGIAAGVVMGVLAVSSVSILRRRGFENTIVHELFHLKMYPLDQVTEGLILANFPEDSPAQRFAYGQFFGALEQTVEELTKCFMLEYGENKELTMGRCEKTKGFNELFDGLKNLE